jgi:hypothetical protein
MPKNEAGANLPENMPSLSKIKLNTIWSELQQNLPSIDFDDDKVSFLVKRRLLYKTKV